MGLCCWLDALRTAWERASCAGSCGRLERHVVADWLRRDLGLAEDEMKSLSERIDEIRGRHGGWL